MWSVENEEAGNKVWTWTIPSHDVTLLMKPKIRYKNWLSDLWNDLLHILHAHNKLDTSTDLHNAIRHNSKTYKCFTETKPLVRNYFNERQMESNFFRCSLLDVGPSSCSAWLRRQDPVSYAHSWHQGITKWICSSNRQNETKERSSFTNDEIYLN
jgi:hypothetical protein